MMNQRSIFRLLLYQRAIDMRKISVSKSTVTQAMIMLRVLHPFQVLAVIKIRTAPYKSTTDNL